MKTGGFRERISCSAKESYGTRAAAAKVARRVRRQREIKVEAYKCKHGCGRFHVGHLPEEKVRRG